MNNLSEKEKNLNNLVLKLNKITSSYTQSGYDAQALITEKKQLIAQKNDLEKKNLELLREHKYLKEKILKLQRDIKEKNKKEDEFNQDIEELNQETESLVKQINKWQM